MNKILVLDMDGTFVDFYGVEGWKHYLDDLQDETPYVIAKPVYDMNRFNRVLRQLKMQGWVIIVNTWLSRTKTEEFHERIRNAKLNWLAKYAVPYDMFISTDYGVDKQSMIKKLGGLQIIADDNADIRATWDGPTIDATQDIIPALESLLIKEVLYVTK